MKEVATKTFQDYVTEGTEQWTSDKQLEFYFHFLTDSGFWPRIDR